MDAQSKFEALCFEYGDELKASYVIGIQLSDIKKALIGEAENRLEKLCSFFTAREYAISIYNESQRAVFKSLENLIAVVGSAGKAAALIGKSPSIVSAIRKGTYNGNVDAIFKDLHAYFEVKKGKAETYAEVEYAPTSISANVYEAIRAVQIRGGCGITTGDPGVGKTKAISKYAADNPTNTIVITGNSFDTTTRAMIEMLAEELGIDEEYNIRRLKKSVVNRLSDGMLIIVDEAQTFRFSALDWLRSVADEYEKRRQTLGVIFIGNHSLRELFTGKNREKRSQLYSRFHVKPRYFSKDIRLSDMKMLFPILVEEHKNGELKFLYRISTASHEGTRTAVRLFANAYDSGDYSINGLALWAKRMDVELKNIPLLLKDITEEKNQ